MAELEQKIKELIVEALMLEDITADEIKSDEPLFVKGLGLDSIDALELAIAIEKDFGVKIQADDEEKRKIFSCVHELATYVSAHQS